MTEHDRQTNGRNRRTWLLDKALVVIGRILWPFRLSTARARRIGLWIVYRVLIVFWVVVPVGHRQLLFPASPPWPHFWFDYVLPGVICISFLPYEVLKALKEKPCEWFLAALFALGGFLVILSGAENVSHHQSALRHRREVAAVAEGAVSMLTVEIEEPYERSYRLSLGEPIRDFQTAMREAELYKPSHELSVVEGTLSVTADGSVYSWKFRVGERHRNDLMLESMPYEGYESGAIVLVRNGARILQLYWELYD